MSDCNLPENEKQASVFDKIDMKWHEGWSQAFNIVKDSQLPLRQENIGFAVTGTCMAMFNRHKGDDGQEAAYAHVVQA